MAVQALKRTFGSVTTGPPYCGLFMPLRRRFAQQDELGRFSPYEVTGPAMCGRGDPVKSIKQRLTVLGNRPVSAVCGNPQMRHKECLLSPKVMANPDNRSF